MARVSGKIKIKQANKKFRHEQKRKQKARAEKVHAAKVAEAKGRHNNERRAASRAYVASLGADLN